MISNHLEFSGTASAQKAVSWVSKFPMYEQDREPDEREPVHDLRWIHGLYAHISKDFSGSISNEREISIDLDSSLPGFFT